MKWFITAEYNFILKCKVVDIKRSNFLLINSSFLGVHGWLFYVIYNGIAQPLKIFTIIEWFYLCPLACKRYISQHLCDTMSIVTVPNMFVDINISFAIIYLSKLYICNLDFENK